jgi:prepilin-type N-terminal cleavage/methylation domain-containing protein
MNSTLPYLQHSSKSTCLAGIFPGSPKSLVLGICRTRVRQIPRGFTLVEIAIAIFIIALLLGSILVPLTTQVESRNFDTTQRILDQARDALLGYAAANGYFPCPASGTSNGQEAVGTNHAAATTCPAAVWGSNMYHGFLPAATLGFTPTDANGYAVDAWGLTQNRIRYSVSNVTVNGITQPFTRVNGMRNAGMSNISSATTLLYVCNSGTGVTATNCNTAVALASSVPVVIWSVGPNAATTSGASVDEAQNPNPVGGSADRIFVSKTRSTVAGSEFDDIVTWIGSATIFNRLIAAGQLP